MGILGGSTNQLLFGLTVVLAILNFLSLRREFPFRPGGLWLQVLPIPLTIGAYWLLFGQMPASPAFAYLGAAGAVLGTLLGLTSKVRANHGRLMVRRSRLYMLFWVLSLILTQGLIKAAGAAVAGIGSALMFFSLGMVVTQHLVTNAKAGGVKRRALAAAGLLVCLLIGAAPFATLAAPDPFAETKNGAEAYFVLAKDAYASGDRTAAVAYANKLVKITGSPGTKAKGYVVIWLCGGGDQYREMAHQAILDSGQMEGVGGNRDGYATLIGLGIIEDVQGWRYRGYAIAPTTNVIEMDGVFAVANSQLPGLWGDLVRDLGLRGMPAMAGVLRILDSLVNDLAASEPVSSTAAASSAAAASGILLVSSLLNLFLTAPTKAAATQQSQPAMPPALDLAAAAGERLHSPGTAPVVAAQGPADGETLLLRGSTDGREYEVRYDAAQGRWINTQSGTWVDIDRFDKWQQDIKQDRQFTTEQTEKIARGEGAADEAIREMFVRQKEQTDLFNQLKLASKIAVQQGMYRDGAPGDVTVKLRELMDQMRDGKQPDPAEVERTLRVVRSRASGRTAEESTLAAVERETSDLASDLRLASSFVLESYRRVFTGRTSDGSVSYLGMGTQILTIAATGGVGEVVFHLGGSLYAMHDAVQNDTSTSWAVGMAVGQVLFSEAVSRSLSLGKPAASPRVITSQMDAMASTLQRAFRVTDPAQRAQALLRTYRNGGMRVIGQLEQAGMLTAAQTRQMNQLVAQQVRQAVDASVSTTVGQIERRTGVSIEQVLIGDSGSSARAASIRSAVTDADNTGVLVFSDQTLAAYARKQGTSVRQAYQDLTREFAEAQTKNVDDYLRSSTGLSAKDVGYNTYAGMGRGAGPVDSYPAGFTRARQAVQGTTTVYRPDAAGGFKGVTTGGQTLVDQEVMNLARYGGGAVGDASIYTAIPKQELQEILNQQVRAIGKAAVAKDASKSLMRAQYVAERLGKSLDPTLVDIARRISRDPQGARAILDGAGISAQEFITRTSESIQSFASSQM